MAWREKIEKHLEGVKKNESLKTYTSIGIGGLAEFLYLAKNFDDLIKAVGIARSAGAPYRVIGRGTNIIVSDLGFEGLLIVNNSNDLVIDQESGRVIADSGVALSRLILEAATAGLGGLEPLYGIPGSVGGAVIGNCGAHGVSIADAVLSASLLISSDKIINCPSNWFKFGYRTSLLKYQKNEAPPVVLKIIFQLQRRRKEDVLKGIAKYKKWREVHQPLGEKTCGSIFRNPAQTDKTAGTPLREKSAGYLLQQVGAKKLKVGDARVSKKHANWIINTGQAKAIDVRTLIEKMRDLVEDNFKITLEEEVEYLGVWNDEILIPASGDYRKNRTSGKS